MHIPAVYYATHPTPLALAFHGVGLNAEKMIRISGLSEQADTSEFIVIYPNGTGENNSWNVVIVAERRPKTIKILQSFVTSKQLRICLNG